MKRLFNKKEAFNQKGIELSKEADRVLKRLINKYSQQEYSLRDIELIINHSVSFQCTMNIAERNATKTKRKTRIKK